MLGIGIDVVEVARIERLLARTPEFAERYFTAAERARCGSLQRGARPYALVFAVKEAFLKAIGTGVLGTVALEHIEVELSGRTAALQLGASARSALIARGAARTWVSVAEDDARAWAAVVIDA